MDEEWAQRLIDMGVQPPDDDEPQITPLHYSPEVAYLAAVVDRLEAVRLVLISVNSEGKAPPFVPMQRPETAFARLSRNLLHEKLLEIDRYILGGEPPS